MTQQVMLKTNFGDIVVTLDAATGAESANDFLRYIGAGHWDASFDKTVAIAVDGTISMTTWDNTFAKFAFQGTIATGQAVLDAITTDASVEPVIYGLEYVLPPEPATQT
jgi:hypothetical protein